jgi:hypothetical protein
VNRLKDVDVSSAAAAGVMLSTFSIVIGRKLLATGCDMYFVVLWGLEVAENHPNYRLFSVLLNLEGFQGYH